MGQGSLRFHLLGLSEVLESLDEKSFLVEADKSGFEGVTGHEEAAGRINVSENGWLCQVLARCGARSMAQSL